MCGCDNHHRLIMAVFHRRADLEGQEFKIWTLYSQKMVNNNQSLWICKLGQTRRGDEDL